MSEVLVNLQLILLIPIGFFLLYLAFFTFLALVSGKQKFFEEEYKRPFAVVIPAHNEEGVIAKTLRSVFALNYPREKFAVIVVADNCTDRTASIAQAEGAKVYERFDSNLRGKGYALRWIFDKLMEEKVYEAVVIVDADSTMSGNFLTVMNFYLSKGKVSLQSTDIVESGPASWSSAMIRISFLLFNYVRPLGRRVIGLPMGLRGNGMCLSLETLKEVPWEAYSLAEDVDYGLQLILRNKLTFFASEAIVYATMPQQAENAQSQRARWEGGRMTLVRKYSIPLLKTAVKRGSYACFDTLVDLITPSIVNMIAIVGIMTFLNVLLVLIGVDGTFVYLVWWFFAGVCGLFHLLLGLYIARADSTLYLALLQVPRYLLWKISLYLHIFRGKNQGEWIRTTREISQVPKNHNTL